MITAAVFVPPNVPDDTDFAVEGLEYIQHRGYAFGGIFRWASDVDKAMRFGAVDVIVFARSRHANGHHWPAEFVDEKTRPLKSEPPKNVPAQRCGAIHWGRERVEQILDGCGPVPRGLNADAIAAARRIARHLSNCRDQQPGY
jgi:hypothetical protein